MSVDGSHDVSQHGEYEKFIKPYFQIVPPRHKIAVELGCHGKENSNTWNLVMDDDWTTLWVDGSNRAIEQCHKDRVATEKPKQIQIVHAVLVAQHRTHEMVTMHEFPTIGHDSLASEWKGKKPQASYKVQPKSVRDVFDLADLPKDFDFLSVDLEGSDAMIIMDMFHRTTYRPQMILLEDQGLLPRPVRTMLHDENYFILARNEVNTCWVKEQG